MSQDTRRPAVFLDRDGALAEPVAPWGIDLAATDVIEDRRRDVVAGRAAGCYSILIERPYSAVTRAAARVETPREVVDAILGHARE